MLAPALERGGDAEPEVQAGGLGSPHLSQGGPGFKSPEIDLQTIVLAREKLRQISACLRAGKCCSSGSTKAATV